MIGVIAAVIGIVIVLLIPWFPANGSRQTGNIRTLYDVLLIVSVPMFVLVLTVVGYSVWKFRMRPGDEHKDGPPIHGNTRLEVVWTAVPAVLIVALCTYAYTVLRSNEDSQKGEVTINVTERQFAFEFSYTGAGGKTIVSPALYLAKGQPVVFKLRSLDVIHSFFVPEFSEKLDAVPGITTTLRVTPTRLGTYPAECTELCGAGHALMRATVRVVTPQAFQTWLQAQKPGGAPPIGSIPANAALAGEPGAGAGAPAGGTSKGASTTTTGASTTTTGATGGTSAANIAAGKAIFTGSSGCSSCHTLAAAGATGTTGPNLGTAIVPDAKKRGLPLNQFIFESITKPNAYLSPGFQPNIMPQTFGQSLTPAQIQALVSFVASATK
jgi:cytochrome c oxidase subunit 2